MKLLAKVISPVRGLPLAVGALVEGAVFVVLTPLCGAVIGTLVGHICGNYQVGLLAGLAVGAALATFGFTDSLDGPVGPGAFIDWFFHSVFLFELALGLAVLTYFLAHRLIPEAFEWNVLVSVLLAFFFGLPASLAVLGHLFPAPNPYQASVAEPLSTFEEALAKANLLARMKLGPAATRRARLHGDGWSRFTRRMAEIRRRFYERK